MKILISLYRVLISPFLPPSCRFYPTCSEYAHGVFSTKGPLTALYLTVRRLSRCHPFNDGGYDPVPATVENRDWIKTRQRSGKEVF